MEFGPRPSDRPGTRKAPAVVTSRSQRKNLKSDDREKHYESLTIENLEEKYPTGLMFYDQPPLCQISLENMEKLAIERLRFLRLIEKTGSVHGGKYWSEEYAASLRTEAKSQHLTEFLDVLDKRGKKASPEVLRNRSKDHFSHFILRLAYCRTEELRKWLAMQESDLMRFRLHQCCNEEMEDFMKGQDLTYDVVSEEEKTRLKDQLLASGVFNLKETPFSELKFYKVHFLEALELVRSRRVYLENGIAFVPSTEVKSLLAAVFKSLLLHNLALTSKALPNLDEDDRLTKMLGDLDRRYTGEDFSVNNNTDMVTAEMVKPLSAKSFPMCMRSQQMAMETQHHLKYKGRLQYGLFLKGIGLSMEEATRYFRGEFTQSHVSAEKFDKEYVYGIRYNYGKEGKKVNWAPWSCMRIIMENVGPGESHGCPYRHSDPESLRSLLAKNGIEGEDLEEILRISKEGHYQKACSMQFRVAHKGQEISSGMTEHPNQYYKESVKGGTGVSTTKPTIKTEKTTLYLENKKST